MSSETESTPNLTLPDEERSPEAKRSLETSQTYALTSLEAQLQLLTSLHHEGREEEGRRLVGGIAETLSRYPLFWKALREHWRAEEKEDVALAATFIAAWFDGEAVSWTSLLGKVLSDQRLREGYAHRQKSRATLPTAEAPMAHPAETTRADVQQGAGHPRTLTMADILAAQGNVREAESIYRELLKVAENDRRRDLLLNRIEALRKPGPADIGQSILDMLTLLAERLERRALAPIR